VSKESQPIRNVDVTVPSVYITFYPFLSDEFSLRFFVMKKLSAYSRKLMKRGHNKKNKTRFQKTKTMKFKKQKPQKMSNEMEVLAI